MERTFINEQDLRRLQMIQLDLLKEIDRVCKKNDIRYCIIAGTALGATRHGGYIPWDDDADVAMLREEYDKFVEVCFNELDESKFYFQDNEHTKGYRWGYGKLRRKNTKFIRLNQENMPYKSGVFIDVFPLDYVPKNKLVRKFHNLQCTIVRKFMWSEIGKNSEQNPIKKLIYKFMSIKSEKNVYKLYEKLKINSNKKKTDMVRILTFPTPNNGHYGYYERWYTDLKDIEFEGVMLPAARELEQYLTFKFGDFMTLPPEEQRKVHPVSSYDFDIEEN